MEKVSCGTDHSFVVVNGKLLVFGKHTFGRLGIGPLQKSIYSPTTLVTLLVKLNKVVFSCFRM